MRKKRGPATAEVITGMVKTEVHDHWLYDVRMLELERLLESLGYSLAHRIVQARRKPTTSHLFGSGKVQEIRRAVDQSDADLFAVYNILTIKQKWNLERELGIDVDDRYEVTLRIFEKEARDVLSNLQIKLASLRKSFPYVKYRASFRYKRMRPGYRGGGEYAYHRTIRAVQKRIKNTKERIDKLLVRKKERILRRLENGEIVVIGGYYNAGKTSLFNSLTGLDKPVSDAPFTTLSSKYASIMGGAVYLVDTIGFVLDLDPELIHSFQLNLLDLKHASSAVLVVDASEEQRVMRLKLAEGLGFIKNIRGDLSSTIVALNKTDKLDPNEVQGKVDALREELGPMPLVPISAKTGAGLDDLLALIRQRPADISRAEPELGRLRE